MIPGRTFEYSSGGTSAGAGACLLAKVAGDADQILLRQFLIEKDDDDAAELAALRFQ